jgi:hypothetical protein
VRRFALLLPLALAVGAGILWLGAARFRKATG